MAQAISKTITNLFKYSIYLDIQFIGQQLRLYNNEHRGGGGGGDSELQLRWYGEHFFVGGVCLYGTQFL